MAMEVTVQGRLYGESTLWVFSRFKDSIEDKQPVIQIQKDPDSQRIYSSFGSLGFSSRH